MQCGTCAAGGRNIATGARGAFEGLRGTVSEILQKDMRGPNCHRESRVHVIIWAGKVAQIVMEAPDGRVCA